MNYQWNLSVLYPGIDSKEYQDDFQFLDELIQNLEEKADALFVSENPSIALSDFLKEETRFMEKALRLHEYVFLKQSVDTTNAEVANAINQLQNKLTKTTIAMTKMKKFVSLQDDLDDLIGGNTYLKEHEFLLDEIKKLSRYQLNENEEEIISKLYLNGGNNWSNLQEYLTSTLAVDYKGDQTTLPAIRNLAYSDDAETRKSAYEAEIASYDKIKDAISFSLNSIKGEVNSLCELRGYNSAIERTLVNSRMSQSTLDSLLAAIQKSLPKFQAYLKHKSLLLGHQNGLPWYDLFAPIGEKGNRFEIEDAQKFIIKQFGTFSDDLAQMAHDAFEQEWIDFLPRSKKVGGAFCANLSVVKQSRILTNYDYTLSDVVTLAHELGHAYHGMHIQNHSILNTDYTMPVAETASTFCESIVMNAVLKDADKKEKVKLLESTIQDFTQIIVDIYSRYLFEEEVFLLRKSAFLFSNELEEIMISAQKKAYGNGLDVNYLHPYMWINKSHYYSVGISFYNFPYAFGGLFAKGLYAKYVEEGKSFVEKYQKLLQATTVNTVEDVAAMVGIDITQQSFWDKSLEMVEEMIDEFIEITKEDLV